VVGAAHTADVAVSQSDLAVGAPHCTPLRRTAVSHSTHADPRIALGNSSLDRGVTTPTTYRMHPVAARGRALNENQRPGAFPGEGVRMYILGKPRSLNSRFLVLGLTLAAMLSLSGYAAASSSAAGFHFGDGAKELVPNGTLFQSALKPKTSASLSYTIGGIPLILTSSNGVIEGTLNNEGGVGHAKEATLTFTGVTVNHYSGCTIESTGAGAGTIVTKKLKGEALAGPAVEFSPEAGATEPFAELVFGGANCSIDGWQPKLSGTLRGTASGRELIFNSDSGSDLKLGGNTGHFTATFLTAAAGRPVVVE